MDTERTMQFILDNLASVTAKQEKAETQIQAIRKLVLTGMKMVVEIGKEQKKTRRAMTELAAGMDKMAKAQKEADLRFSQWLAATEGSNGHKNGKGHKKKPN
jgi:peptidoglycan hydrolase CwlO-like protein